MRQPSDVRGPPLDLDRKVRGLLAQGPRSRVEVDEDEPAELLHLHLVQADLGLVEGVHTVGAARPLQLPVEAVDPRVVGTDDAAGGP